MARLDEAEQSARSGAEEEGLDPTEAVDFLRYYAIEAERIQQPIMLTGPTGESNELRLTPRGPWVCISPWNFPLVLAVRKVAPALAAGCPVILKPARQTPLSCVAFAECVHAAQLPKGVFQVVCGPSDEFGQEFFRARHAPTEWHRLPACEK